VSRNNVRLLLTLVALIALVKFFDRRSDPGSTTPAPSREERAAQQLDVELTPAAAAESKEGLAAAIVIDVSGSMDETVKGQKGSPEKKIEIARRTALEAVDQFVSYAKEHPDEPVLLGVYEFSRRRGDPDCRPIVPMGPPDRERAAAAIVKLDADGGTPIGQAMITAKKELDGTGLTHRHLLLVTDGENTDGVRPERVAEAINRRPDAERPAIYFVAFDIEASRFNAVKNAGGLVLSAATANELSSTLDSLLRGKILVEK
jgi:von Willebrand factor type A domain